VSRREPDINKSHSAIVGMSWLASQQKHNASTVPDFGTSVISLNCDIAPSPRPIIRSDLMRYAQYATQCVTTGNLRVLLDFVENAKQQEKTWQAEDFLNFYREEIEGEPFTQEQCATILELKKN